MTVDGPGLAETMLGLMWVGLTLYVLLGGADFGAGVWDLLAGGTDRGRDQRRFLEHAIGPVWEANHVWLIFVVVLMWTAIPSVFASVSSTMYVPLTLVALGIIARGSAFAFRKASTEPWQQRLFGATFAFSSLVTPYFLGAVAGGIASGRVPDGIAAGDLVTSWLNPTSTVAGLLSVGTAAYLAAVYLTRDAERAGEAALVAAFRRRALVSGVVVGALSLAGLVVLRADAPELFDAMTTGVPLAVAVTAVTAGVVSLALLARGRYLAVRVTAPLAVTALLWAWGAAQYPELLPGVTLTDAAATDAVLGASLAALGVGGALLVPSLWWLFRTFQQEDAH